ncbi:hypothetical protein NDK43_23850 [Neobacillus pocheonensis]|uniref:Nucleotide modification associated domain-containing protein n=1 Tax=Neobacillus pocheonensis TaxID=363869 RepID=A0ABT0WIB3_9BACI|nr:hypothetical protein [Neobacillus pocheonensis]
MPRKVILSRKGFDSKSGGWPSFIYGNRLVSLPIPGGGSGIFYNQLQFDSNTPLSVVMQQVGIAPYNECHLDPDLQQSFHAERPKNWKAAFGQADQFEKRLKKYGVGTGDIFLFYGWFRAIRSVNGSYQYIKGAPNLHVIYGYMEMEEVFDLTDPGKKAPSYLVQHPHVVFREKYKNANRIYVGTNAGIFYFHDSLVLTRKGETRSRWELPSFFEKEPFMGARTIDQLPNANIGIDFRGRNNQELLITSTKEVVEWAEQLIQKNQVQK